MSTTIEKQARFNARLPKEQKLLFERASVLGGFRNLTDFILQTAQKRAKEIIEEKEEVIASKKDAEIFYDAITNFRAPSKKLKEALNDYNQFLSNEQ